jgi:hypothetical protein
VNPNTPVLVGVSQILQRIDDPLLGKEPVQMMLDAILPFWSQQIQFG